MTGRESRIGRSDPKPGAELSVPGLKEVGHDGGHSTRRVLIYLLR